MFKTENHCKTPQVVAASDGIRHTRKRELRTLSLKTIYKKDPKRGKGLIFGVLRYWKAEYMIFQIETLFNMVHF